MKISSKSGFCGVMHVFSITIITIMAAYASFSQNSINGMVFDEKRQPISNVEVELLDEFYRRIKGVTTQSGSFMFSNLRSGNYYVKVRGNNSFYKEKIEPVRDLGISNGVNTTTNRVIGRDSIQVMIYLEPNRKNEQNRENGVVFVQEVPESARKVFSYALASLEKGKTEEAIPNLQKAIEIFPNYYDALLLLGNQFISKQQFEDAENVLMKALEVNSRGVGCYEGLGYVKYKLNKREEAVGLLEKALQINSKSEDSYVWLGIIHRMSKNYEIAESILKKGNEITEKKNPNIHWQLALLYNDMKLYGEAANELTIFLKLQPDSQDKEKIKKLIEQLREKK